MRIGILSAIDIAYLGHALGAFLEHKIAIDCMLLDATPRTAKDLAILYGRVGVVAPRADMETSARLWTRR